MLLPPKFLPTRSGLPYQPFQFKLLRFSLLIITIIKISPLQIQRPIPEADPEVGERPWEHKRRLGALVVRAEPVGLPGGRVRGWGHCQAAPKGS